MSAHGTRLLTLRTAGWATLQFLNAFGSRAIAVSRLTGPRVVSPTRVTRVNSCTTLVSAACHAQPTLHREVLHSASSQKCDLWRPPRSPPTSIDRVPRPHKIGRGAKHLPPIVGQLGYRG